MVGILTLPWCFKPIFGYTFDKMMSVLKKTKYIITTGAIIRILVFSVLTFVNVNAAMFYVFGFILSIVALYENIICEYMLLISSKKENQINGSNNANHLPIFFGFRAFGSVIGSFFGGRIIERFGNQRVFFINMILPIFVIFLI